MTAGAVKRIEPERSWTCTATRSTLGGGVKQCRKIRWGGTPMCYQHAISFGEAIVVTPRLLRHCLGYTDEAQDLADHLWQKIQRNKDLVNVG